MICIIEGTRGDEEDAAAAEDEEGAESDRAARSLNKRRKEGKSK
jgi:hypothetical protein